MSAGFQFKQFYVRHDRCAMKVGTDSIMLGSWTDPGNASRILDIGSGCGVLSLIVAQKAADNASVLGIDLDEAAVQQATENAQASPWRNSVVFERHDAASFDDPQGFDLIISNPPYYVPKRGELVPGEAQYIAPQRRQARHTLSLTHTGLVAVVTRCLTAEGRFCCVLPVAHADVLVTSAQTVGLICTKRTDVRSTPRKPVTRAMLELSRAGTPGKPDLLTIHAPSGEYSEAYHRLCQDFYLGF